MGRLVSGERREAARRARAEQREAIAAAARAAFLVEPYERVTLAAIAARAGVDPGAVSMLAGSRDELLLAAVGETLGPWCRATAVELEARATPLDRTGLARLLARAVAAEPDLPRLLSRLPAAVEAISEPGPVALLVSRLRPDLARLGEAAAAACPSVSRGALRSLPLYLLALVVGLTPFALPVAGVGVALADRELSQLAIDLETELAGLLEAVL